MKKVGRRIRVLGTVRPEDDMLDDVTQTNVLQAAGISSDVLEEMSSEERNQTLTAILESNPFLLQKFAPRMLQYNKADQSHSCEGPDPENGLQETVRTVSKYLRNRQASGSSRERPVPSSDEEETQRYETETWNVLKGNKDISADSLQQQEVPEDTAVETQAGGSSQDSITEGNLDVPRTLGHRVGQEKSTGHGNCDHSSAPFRLEPSTDSKQVVSLAWIYSKHLQQVKTMFSPSFYAPQYIKHPDSPSFYAPQHIKHPDSPSFYAPQHIKHPESPSFYAPQYIKDPESYTQVIKLMLDMYRHQVSRAHKQVAGVARACGRPVTAGPHMAGCLVARRCTMPEDEFVQEGEAEERRVLRRRLHKVNHTQRSVGSRQKRAVEDLEEFDGRMTRSCRQELDDQDSQQDFKKKRKAHGDTTSTSIVRSCVELSTQGGTDGPVDMDEDTVDMDEDTVDSECEANGESDEWFPAQKSKRYNTKGKKFKSWDKKRAPVAQSSEHQKCYQEKVESRQLVSDKKRQNVGKRTLIRLQCKDLPIECDTLIQEKIVWSGEASGSSYPRGVGCIMGRNSPLGTHDDAVVGAQQNRERHFKASTDEGGGRGVEMMGKIVSDEESSNEKIFTPTNISSNERILTPPVFNKERILTSPNLFQDGDSNDSCFLTQARLVAPVSTDVTNSQSSVAPVSTDVTSSQSSESLLDAHGNLYSTEICSVASHQCLDNAPSTSVLQHNAIRAQTPSEGSCRSINEQVTICCNRADTSVLMTGRNSVREKADLLEAQTTRKRHSELELAGDLEERTTRKRHSEPVLAVVLEERITRKRHSELELAGDLEERITRKRHSELGLAVDLEERITRKRHSELELAGDLEERITRKRHSELELAGDLEERIIRKRHSEPVLAGVLEERITRKRHSELGLAVDLEERITRKRHSELGLAVDLEARTTRKRHSELGLAGHTESLVMQCEYTDLGAGMNETGNDFVLKDNSEGNVSATIAGSQVTQTNGKSRKRTLLALRTDPDIWRRGQTSQKRRKVAKKLEECPDGFGSVGVVDLTVKECQGSSVEEVHLQMRKMDNDESAADIRLADNSSGQNSPVGAPRVRGQEGVVSYNICPICGGSFHASLLETHASSCGEEIPAEIHHEELVMCVRCKLQVPPELLQDHHAVCLHRDVPAKRITRSKKDRKHGGIQIRWDRGEELTFGQKWNPWCSDIPWITLSHHPLIYNPKENETVTYNVDEFFETVVSAASKVFTAKRPNETLKVIEGPIRIESYASPASLVFNQSGIGYFRDRNGVSF